MRYLIGFMLCGTGVFFGVMSVAGLPNVSTTGLLGTAVFILSGSLTLANKWAAVWRHVESVSWKDGEVKLREAPDLTPGEKPLPSAGKDTGTPTALERKVPRNSSDLEAIVEDMSPDSVWRTTIKLLEEKKDVEGARRVLDAALKKHEDDPRLLIASGFAWRALRKPEKAVMDVKAAISSAEGREEFEEQYYLANSN